MSAGGAIAGIGAPLGAGGVSNGSGIGAETDSGSGVGIGSPLGAGGVSNGSAIGGPLGAGSGSGVGIGGPVSIESSTTGAVSITTGSSTT